MVQGTQFQASPLRQSLRTSQQTCRPVRRRRWQATAVTSVVALTNIGAGASLRVRGTVAPGDAGEEWVRGIPACAGNSDTCEATCAQSSGHPCACGEQCGPWAASWLRNGSSLRVRGIARYWRHPGRFSRVIPACAGGIGGSLLHAGPVGRVIPACAGNRASAWSGQLGFPGHPCVCGEQSIVGAPDSSSSGSSLRVRGTVSVIWCAIEFSGQIHTP